MSLIGVGFLYKRDLCPWIASLILSHDAGGNLLENHSYLKGLQQVSRLASLLLIH